MTEKQPLEILLIDNDPDLLELFGEYLPFLAQQLGLSTVITTAVDGQDGIGKFRERLATNPYDTVFTDLNMPNMDGTQVTEFVKKFRPATLVAVVTGYEPNEEYAKLRRKLGTLSPDYVIGKPPQGPDIQIVLRDTASRKYAAKASSDHIPLP